MVLNAGNSRLAIGIFSAGNLEYVARVPKTRQEDWPAAIALAWEKISAKEQPVVAGAGVNPSLETELDKIVQQMTGQAIQWVGRQLDLPIKVRTLAPGQTGVDRVLNVAAAYEQMGKACVVVDAGTAITIDCCNDQGEFLGGAIAAGMAMLLDALHEKTALLPAWNLPFRKMPRQHRRRRPFARGFILAFAGWCARWWKITPWRWDRGRRSSPRAGMPGNFSRIGN